jgi:hypothetical protein
VSWRDGESGDPSSEPGCRGQVSERELIARCLGLGTQNG